MAHNVAICYALGVGTKGKLRSESVGNRSRTISGQFKEPLRPRSIPPQSKNSMMRTRSLWRSTFKISHLTAGLFTLRKPNYTGGGRRTSWSQTTPPSRELAFVWSPHLRQLTWLPSRPWWRCRHVQRFTRSGK